MTVEIEKHIIKKEVLSDIRKQRADDINPPQTLAEEIARQKRIQLRSDWEHRYSCALCGKRQVIAVIRVTTVGGTKDIYRVCDGCLRAVRRGDVLTACKPTMKSKQNRREK